MPVNPTRTDDREFDLAAEVMSRYGVKLTSLETKLLQLLIDLRSAAGDRIDDHLWPDDDAFDRDLPQARRVHIYNIRKKFGDLIELVTFFGQGYSLKRLGPPDNPMHERKN